MMGKELIFQFFLNMVGFALLGICSFQVLAEEQYHSDVVQLIYQCLCTDLQNICESASYDYFNFTD